MTFARSSLTNEGEKETQRTNARMASILILIRTRGD